MDSGIALESLSSGRPSLLRLMVLIVGGGRPRYLTLGGREDLT